jgi:hypothetical protein
MANGTLSIDAEDTGTDCDRFGVMDPARVQMEYDENDGTRECKHCGTRIELMSVQKGGKWTEQWQHNDGNAECMADAVKDEPTVAEPRSLGCADIVNSAAIDFDDDEMECTVSISVGDPRGAFTMTVRRTPDGKLILHVPYEGEPLPHMPIKKLHDGTYEIVNG